MLVNQTKCRSLNVASAAFFKLSEPVRQRPYKSKASGRENWKLGPQALYTHCGSAASLILPGTSVRAFAATWMDFAAKHSLSCFRVFLGYHLSFLYICSLRKIVNQDPPHPPLWRSGPETLTRPFIVHKYLKLGFVLLDCLVGLFCFRQDLMQPRLTSNSICKDDLNFWSFCLVTHVLGLQAWAIMLDLCGIRNLIQGWEHARQASTN